MDPPGLLVFTSCLQVVDLRLAEHLQCHLTKCPNICALVVRPTLYDLRCEKFLVLRLLLLLNDIEVHPAQRHREVKAIDPFDLVGFAAIRVKHSDRPRAKLPMNDASRVQLAKNLAGLCQSCTGKIQEACVLVSSVRVQLMQNVANGEACSLINEHVRCPARLKKVHKPRHMRDVLYDLEDLPLVIKGS